MEDISGVVQTSEIFATLSKLEEYRETHPNLYRLWHNYVMLENQHFMNIVSKCNQAMRSMDHEGDISISSLLAFMLVNRSLSQ